MENNDLFILVETEINAQQTTEHKITREKLLKEDLALPSIKLIMILTNLTSRLGISIMDFSDYELLRLKSVGDLVDLLTTKKTMPLEN